MPQHRHTNQTAGQFFDRKELVDSLQHLDIVSLLRVDLGKRIPILLLVIFSNFIRFRFFVLGQIHATKIQPCVVPNDSLVAEQPNQNRTALQAGTRKTIYLQLQEHFA